MYRITIGNEKTIEVAEIEYITFNAFNGTSYFCEGDEATGISTGDNVYIVKSLLTSYYKEKLLDSLIEKGLIDYKFAEFEEISSDGEILKMKEDLEKLRSKTSLIDEQNITIMAAIADLYAKIGGK